MSERTPPDLEDLDRQYAEEAAAGKKGNGAAKPAPTLVHVQQFVAGYKAPEYAIDGLLQRGRLYTCTALTGHGKTAVALCLAIHMALGRDLAGRSVEQGTVVYFAAENPDDVRARIILMADRLQLDLSSLPLHFIEGGFSLDSWNDRIRTEVERIGGALSVMVDTGPAFLHACGFADENDNIQALRFALQLRELTRLSGNPMVLVPTHPTKNAPRDYLLPRGGGAFLNEMDGNFTLWAEGERETTELHWAGKLRGPAFDPICFALDKGTCPGVVDHKGRMVPSVWAYQVDQRRADSAASRQREDEDAVLVVMHQAPDRTLSSWAELLGWMSSTTNEPLKMRVSRTLDRLRIEKLVTQKRKRWILTGAGRVEAEKLEAQTQNA